MGDWDPLAEVDENKESYQIVDVAGMLQGMGMPAGTIEEGHKVYKSDWDKTVNYVWEKLNAASPWVTFPDPKPDLSWHEPTCTFENWTHKDVKIKLGQHMIYITLDRPSDNNKLTASAILALTDAVFLLHQRKDIRFVCFTGEGSMFCSGGDPKGEGFGGFTSGKYSAAVEKARAALVEKAKEGGAFPDGKVNVGRLLQAKFWHTMAMLPQFTVALCNGSTMGDGIGLISCCDMAIAVKSAFFCISDVKVGLIPAMTSPYIMAKTGNGIAKKIFCTSENMDAEKAIFNRIVEEAVENLQEGQKRIAELCVQITECPPDTLEFSKRLMMGVVGQQNQEPLMHYQLAMHYQTSVSKDAQNVMTKPWMKNTIVPP